MRRMPVLRGNETTTCLERINILAPSIFAEQPSNDRSEKYVFIPTSAIVARLLNEGFAVSRVQEQRTRIEDRVGFTRHMVRFRHDGLMPKVDDIFPEILLINSHDGSSSFQITAGLFRLACLNGLVIGDEHFTVRQRHSGSEHDVIDGVFRVVDEIPEVMDTIHRWDGIPLTDHERTAFARAAIPLRFEEDDNGNVPVDPRQVLRPRRTADQRTDLLSTYNVVQENLLKGGLSAKTKTGKLRRSTAVNGLQADVKLNKALWMLTESMAALKNSEPLPAPLMSQ